MPDAALVRFIEHSRTTPAHAARRDAVEGFPSYPLKQLREAYRFFSVVRQRLMVFDGEMNTPNTADYMQATATGYRPFGDPDTLLRQHCLELATKHASDTGSGTSAIERAREYYDFIKGAGKPQEGKSPDSPVQATAGFKYAGPNSFEASVEPAKVSNAAKIEQVAEHIYNAMVIAAETHQKPLPWYPGGNSDMQTEARRRARNIVEDFCK